MSEIRLDDAPTALFIRHDPEAHPGRIGRRLAELGFDTVELDVITDHAEPNPVVDYGDPGRWDVIVSLGCIWSVYDEASIGNWIGAELEFLAEAQRRDVPILGSCFGGQALAAALGGVVEPTPVPEIGWHGIESDKPEAVPAGPWMQWHWDRFSVPAGATELARSPSGPQAFVIGRSLGVQFHPEVTAEIVTGWLDVAPAEELERPGVDPAAIRDGTDRHAEAAGRSCDTMVDWFVSDVAGVAAPGLPEVDR